VNAAPAAKLAVGFRARAVPLEASGVYADGAVAVALALQLAGAAREQLRELRAAVVQRALIVLGPEHALPWVDGVTFVGACARAPELLLPTYCEPDVPVDLVLRALAPRQGAERGGCYLLLPHARSVITIAHAARADAEALRLWGAAAQRAGAQRAAAERAP
jgi:hypothetical protein